MSKNTCKACYHEASEGESYCSECIENRRKNKEIILSTQWSRDFDRYIRTIEQFSVRGMAETAKEAVKYDEDLKRKQQKV